MNEFVYLLKIYLCGGPECILVENVIFFLFLFGGPALTITESPTRIDSLRKKQ